MLCTCVLCFTMNCTVRIFQEMTWWSTYISRSHAALIHDVLRQSSSLFFYFALQLPTDVAGEKLLACDRSFRRVCILGPWCCSCHQMWGMRHKFSQPRDISERFTSHTVLSQSCEMSPHWVTTQNTSASCWPGGYCVWVECLDKPSYALCTNVCFVCWFLMFLT